MSSWVALNIEPDEAVEVEVDDTTKEIQIEETLKLYQNALKFHSQGPSCHAEAAEAYDALFKSEIFRYPESASAFKTLLQENESQQVVPEGAAPEPVAEYTVNESTSNTLLQTIFLSYKNYGQFLLDSLHHLLQIRSHDLDAAPELAAEVLSRCNSALATFADALERDDTDLDLWRRCARLSSALQSFRLTRFCLESVLADDENRLEVRSQQMGLEEGFAQERLRDVLQALSDRLSMCQIPVKRPKKAFLNLLRRQTDPYPYLPALPEDLQRDSVLSKRLAIQATPHLIKLEAVTWDSVGKALLQAPDEEGEEAVILHPESAIRFSIPCLISEAKRQAAEEIQQPDQETVPHISTEEGKDSDMCDGGDQHVESHPSPESKPNVDSTIMPEEHSSRDQRADNKSVESLEKTLKSATGVGVHKESTSFEGRDQKPTTNLCRKRSSPSVTNNEDASEGGRLKSRRTRARESNTESLTQLDEAPFDQSKYYEDKLEIYFQADEWMFEIVWSLMSKVGVEALGSIDKLKEVASLTTARADTNGCAEALPKVPEAVLIMDFRDVIQRWNEDKYRNAFKEDTYSALQDVSSMGKSGLALFLEHSKGAFRMLGTGEALAAVPELCQFLDAVNRENYSFQDVVLYWLEGLLMPAYGNHRWQEDTFDKFDSPTAASTYVSSQWSESLKEIVVQLLLREDEYIYRRMCQRVEDLENQLLKQTPAATFKYDRGHFCDMVMIQTIFELHLDAYSLFDSSVSESDKIVTLQQKDRLGRWAMLARTSVNHFLLYGVNGTVQDNIALRHLWASTFHSNMAGDAQRDHILLCLQDLKHILHCFNNIIIKLANNAMMPEISAIAVDQEIAKLKSIDFFLKLFSPELEDPVTLIETIVPILEPSSVEVIDESADPLNVNTLLAQRQETASFLERTDATLRLFLWKRLQDAYRAIDYPPKVISCLLRSIEAIVNELWGSSNIESPVDFRHLTLLRWLKSLDTVLIDVTNLVLRECDKAFECLGMDHLRSSATALSRLLKVLHGGFTLYEDAVRVGQITGPDFRGSLLRSLEGLKDKLHDMEVRCWVLLYALFKEAVAQNREVFKTPSDDCIRFLRSVHNALGIRSMCKNSNKQFLKLMQTELLALKTDIDLELDISQVLFDLYGVKFSSSILHSDHNCPIEKLDKSTAGLMVDFVMAQVEKMSMKDLCKSELKNTLDKMVQALGTFKSSSHLSLNRRLLNGYLASPINPAQLIRYARGIGDISLHTVSNAESSTFARKGWFSLLGQLSLTKFRSQKRLSPVPTSDLDDAIHWFKKDIEHGNAKWETWYRLAQAYDLKLEEDITWSADKINNNQAELSLCQRNAINCYAMAISTAIREGSLSQENRELLSELYTDFGIRLYSSSREPLSMAAFSLEEFARHFSNVENQEMYKDKPFKEMDPYAVWNFASFLFKRAIVDKPKRWVNHYMLSKCLWKMFCCDDLGKGSFKRIHVVDVLDSLSDAIDNLPEKKDSRSDPIFEPHYKLVSVTHKLVQMGVLTPAEGSKILLATPWAYKATPPEDQDTWKRYILEVLRILRHTDKSNWHHRMAVRAAHIIYDDRQDEEGAAAAKQELSQIFTKTLAIQVWKPEFERAGRHFVYTTRYVYFFVRLLDQLNDRASLDQLLRRVRKKQGDFINHTKLWEDMCLTYARIIRRVANIKEGYEEGIFKPVGWDEFVTNTARLEELPKLIPESTFFLEMIRDSIELKKLNNNLIKVTMFEDLIADLYSRLYEMNIPQLAEQSNEENKEKMKMDHLLISTDTVADAPTPHTSNLTSEAPTARGRTKGIARRDIQKRAEAIVNRKAPGRPAAMKASAPPADGSLSVQLSSSAAGHLATAAKVGSRREAGNNNAANPPVPRKGSIPDSPQESADEESELSEMDDENLAKLATERKLPAWSMGAGTGTGTDGIISEVSDFEDGRLNRNGNQAQPDSIDKQRIMTRRVSLMFPNLTRKSTLEPGSELSLPASVDRDEAEPDSEPELKAEAEPGPEPEPEGELRQCDDGVDDEKEGDGEEKGDPELDELGPGDMIEENADEGDPRLDADAEEVKFSAEAGRGEEVRDGAGEENVDEADNAGAIDEHGHKLEKL